MSTKTKLRLKHETWVYIDGEGNIAKVLRGNSYALAIQTPPDGMTKVQLPGGAEVDVNRQKFNLIDGEWVLGAKTAADQSRTEKRHRFRQQRMHRNDQLEAMLDAMRALRSQGLDLGEKMNAILDLDDQARELT